MNVNNASWSHPLISEVIPCSLRLPKALIRKDLELDWGCLWRKAEPFITQSGDQAPHRHHWVKHTNGLQWVGYFSSEMMKYLGLEWKLNPHFLLLYYTATLQTHHSGFHTCIHIFAVADGKKWTQMKDLHAIFYFQGKKIMKSTEIWFVLTKYNLGEK